MDNSQNRFVIVIVAAAVCFSVPVFGLSVWIFYVFLIIGFAVSILHAGLWIKDFLELKKKE